MKFVIPGGSGQVGMVLQRALRKLGHRVVVLSRKGDGADVLAGDVVDWDGRTLGAWASEIDGADVVINLARRSVNCRYTQENLQMMMASRVDSTRVVGEAIAKAARPPALWMQMSTATIYAHRFDAANDEATGIIGGNEPDVPDYWGFSIKIAQEWERAQADAQTPQTRKVALRTAMVMSPDADGVFDVLLRLTRFGLGGTLGSGRQYVSWIHEDDFVRAVLFLVERQEMDGPVNLCAPNPLPQASFQRALREAWGIPIGLPALAWMAEIGAFFLRTDTELILKSRRAIPGRLRQAGFTFQFPEWPVAAKELVTRWRQSQ